MNKVIDKKVASVAEKVSSAYVPPLQVTKGQPPPIAANGGLSYMSFDKNGDALQGLLKLNFSFKTYNYI